MPVGEANYSPKFFIKYAYASNMYNPQENNEPFSDILTKQTLPEVWKLLPKECTA